MGVYNNPSERPLPSVGRHALAATLLVTALVGGGAALLMGASADPDRWGGELALPEIAPPPASDTLLAEAGESALPDLLDGEVEDGANPTEMVGSVTPTTPSTAKRIDMSDAPPSSALPKAPLAELQTRSSFGDIPMKAEDGRTAFAIYARPFKGTAKPDVSVVVGGLGINAEMTRRAIEELPPDVTLSFAAHAPRLQSDIDLARSFGHEVLLELPMEGASDDPAEPGADRRLTVESGPTALRNLDYLLSRAGGYFAVTPFGGEVFLGSSAAKPVLKRLEDAGLGLVTDSQGTAEGLEQRALEMRLPFRDGTMLIDAEPDRALIDRDLEALRALALAGEAPIGFGFAYPQTLDALADWLPTLDRAELAPASAAMK